MAEINKWSAAIRPDFETIERLGIEARWCAWRYKDRGLLEKPQKIPCSKSRQLKTSDPGGWISFQEARALYGVGGYDGVGMLPSTCARPVVVFDFDKCLDEKCSVIAEHEAVAALVAMGSYIEFSPSGTGLRGFVYGRRPDNCDIRKGSLEVYDNHITQYLTVTGGVYGMFRPVIENQAAIDAFMVRFGFVRQAADPAAGRTHMRTAPAGIVDPDFPPKSDDEILKLLRQNNKRGALTRLLAGDTKDYGGNSEARAGLIGHCAYYSNDVEQIARIVEASGLLDTKARQERVGKPFAAWEVERVLDGLSGRASYWVDRAEKAAGAVVAKAMQKGQQEKATEFLVGGFDGLLNAKGALLSNLYVHVELLHRDKRLLGATWFDEFRMDPVKTPAFGVITGGRVLGGPIVDADVRAVAIWLAREWGMSVAPKDTLPILLAWAEKTRRNPVVERLNELAEQYDGVPRLGRWLIDYCGAGVGASPELVRYLEAVGERWLIAVVARAFKPGSQVDTMLVLEGPQGSFKSTVARVLACAIDPSTFLEGFDLAGMGKDTLMMMRGRGIIEWGELSGLSRHDSNLMKNFLSRLFDAYRAVWGFVTQDWPRTAVFLGTTNDQHYIRDVTGNRRFWPVRVGQIDIEKLRRDAPLLLAEAVQKYRAGARWWIDETGEEDEKVRRVQHSEVFARMMPDAWREMVQDFNSRLFCKGVKDEDGETKCIASSFRLIELMQLILGDQKPGDRSPADENRLRNSLAGEGWESFVSGGYTRWRVKKEKRSSMEIESRPSVPADLGGGLRAKSGKGKP